jgi:hypothetical protein
MILDTPGLFKIRLNNNRPIRAPGQDPAVRRESHVGQRRWKRSHPPSQLQTLSKWSREASNELATPG